MNTLILFNGSFPNGYAPTEHVRKLAEGLSHYSGVTVFIPHSAEHMKSPHPQGEVNGAHFYFALQNDRWTGKNVQKRFLYQLHRLKKTLAYLWRNSAEYDVCYFYDIGIPVFLRIVMALIAKLRHCVIIQEYTEKPYVCQKYGGTSRFWEEHLLLSLIDGCVVISDALRTFLSRYTKIPFQKIPILINEDDYAEALEKLPSPLNCPYIIHIGTLTEQKDNIIVFMQAFSLLVKRYSEPVKLVLTCPLEESPQYHELQDIVQKEHLQDRIICTGYLDDTELLRYLTNAELAVIAKQDNEQNRYCFPTKLGQYLCHGVPTLISSVGEMSEYVTDGKDAYVMADLSPGNICSRMLEVLNDPIKAEIGLHGRETAIREFACGKNGKVLFDFFCSILNSLHKGKKTEMRPERFDESVGSKKQPLT